MDTPKTIRQYAPMPEGVTLESILEFIRPEAEERGMPPQAALVLILSAWKKGGIVDPNQLESICNFSAVTGTSVERVIYEAVADHIECCLPPELEDFAKQAGVSFDSESSN